MPPSKNDRYTHWLRQMSYNHQDRMRTRDCEPRQKSKSGCWVQQAASSLRHSYTPTENSASPLIPHLQGQHMKDSGSPREEIQAALAATKSESLSHHSSYAQPSLACPCQQTDSTLEANPDCKLAISPTDLCETRDVVAEP
uniref:Uncharacterized protein n=1 Tax=Physcomitrium patens TaxID=3218 RepID=A0A2K1JHC3_PHYPA|nr:hypothetical protein PHYPA_018322 [Physcomitrium patens]